MSVRQFNRISKSELPEGNTVKNRVHDYEQSYINENDEMIISELHRSATTSDSPRRKGLGSGDGIELGNGNKTFVQQVMRGEIHREMKSRWRKKGSNNSSGTIEMIQRSYPQIDVVPVTVQFDENKVMDFCRGYCAMAINRLGDIPVTTLLNGVSTISTPQIAAYAMFTSIYQATNNEIPLIQRATEEFFDLLRACMPKLTDTGISYHAEWDDDLLPLLQTFFYNASANPFISLAPKSGANQLFGCPNLNNTIPLFTLEDVMQLGPVAFETILNAMIDKKERIVSWFADGQYSQNTAIFAVARGTDVSPPLIGFVNLLHEVPLQQKDSWLWMLNWSNQVSNREGWTSRSAQVGSHLALYRMLVGASNCPTKALVHNIDIATALFQTMSRWVAMDYNGLDENPNVIDSTPIFLSPFLSQFFPGEVLFVILASLFRRFYTSTCLCTANRFIDNQVQCASGGSRALTHSVLDTVTGWLADTEDLGAIESFIYNGTLHVPVLTTRGMKLSYNVFNPVGTSYIEFLHFLYPTTNPIVTTYSAPIPTPSDLPSIVDFSVDTYIYGLGSKFEEAMLAYSSLVDSGQHLQIIDIMTGNSDGFRNKHLYLTQIITPWNLGNGYNTTPLQNVQYLVSTQYMDRRYLNTMSSRLYPVTYLASGNVVPFTVVYKRPHRIVTDQMYAECRQADLLRSAHRPGANLFAPDTLSMRHIEDTAVGDGGNFVDMFRDRNGKWVDMLSAFAQGMGDFLSPEIGKLASQIVKKVGPSVHDMFSGAKGKKKREAMTKARNEIPGLDYALTPISSKFITGEECREAYHRALDYVPPITILSSDEVSRNKMAKSPAPIASGKLKRKRNRNRSKKN